MANKKMANSAHGVTFSLNREVVSDGDDHAQQNAAVIKLLCQWCTRGTEKHANSRRNGEKPYRVNKMHIYRAIVTEGHYSQGIVAGPIPSIKFKV
jgi:hypothetical protein